MSDAMSTHAHIEPHPIGLIVADDLQRTRLTVFFRILLAIPHLLFVALWSIAAFFVVFAAWIVGVFTGRVPDGLHNFLASFLRYSTRVTAYVFLLADPWPAFSGSEGGYPIDVRVEPPESQSRLTIGFRLILAIPVLILSQVFRYVNQVVAFLGWFYAVATGRMSEGMRNLSAWLLRFEVQTYAYVMLLTGRYPSLAGAPTP
jgi:hypothetical protein